MSDSCLLAAVRGWLAACPAIESALPSGRTLRIHWLGDGPVEFSLESAPGTPAAREYLRGGGIRQSNFVLASRMPLGPDVAEAALAGGIFEQISAWLRAQNEAQNFPAVPSAQVRRVEVTSPGYLLAATRRYLPHPDAVSAAILRFERTGLILKLSELMAGHTPSAAYAGFAEADTWVLALQTAASQTSPADYAVFQVGVVDQSLDLKPKTADATYVRAGTATAKTGNSARIKLDHDRCFGDAAQDFIDSYAVRWGTGDEVKAAFVYFSLLTGKGIQGTGHIVMDGGPTSGAGETGRQEGTLYLDGKPKEYVWAAA